ncbi:MAG: fatty acid desaturase [Acidimicrobiaceae bacterium]|jgi:fatty acid desaturase|nr:fatty acid desaturase [Acidimicrobiaceae bacterium]
MSEIDIGPLPTARSFSELVRAERLTEPSSTYSSLRLVAFLGGWPALYFLAHWARNPFVWLLAWVLQALIFEGCNIGVHESAHNNLYRRRSLNYLAGVAWAVPIVYNYAPYRASHLEHHKNTHVPGRDSEPMHKERNLLEYAAYMALSGVGYTFVLLVEGIEATLGRGRSWMRSGRRRRLAILSTAIMVSELALVGFGLAEAPRLTIELWLVPFLLSAMILTPMVTHAEHTDCELGPSSPFVTTRTTYSNRFVSFFIWNINLHTAHHLVPSIPGQKLPKFQPYVDPYCKYTSRSYFSWHAGFARRLVGRGRTPSTAGSIAEETS